MQAVAGWDRKNAIAFMADKMGPICQTSPRTLSESLEICSQLALAGAQTSSQRGKLTFSTAIIVKVKGQSFTKCLKLFVFFEVLFI